MSGKSNSIALSEDEPQDEQFDESGKTVLSPQIIIAVIGFALTLACPTFLVFFGFDSLIAIQWRVLFGCTFFLTCFFSWFFAQWLQYHRITFLIVTIFCSCISLIGTSSLLGSLGMALHCAVLGVASAFALILWLEQLCGLVPKTIRGAISIGMTLAYGLCLILLTVVDVFRLLSPVVFIIVSIVLYEILRIKLGGENNTVNITTKSSDARSNISINSSTLTASSSIVQGFAAFYISNPSYYDHNLSILFCLVVAIVGLIISVDSFRSFAFTESRIRYTILPIETAFLLLLMLVPDQYSGIASLICLILVFPAYASALFATCEHIVRSRLSAIRAGGLIRGLVMFGLTVGVLIGYASVQYQGTTRLSIFAALILLNVIINVVFDQKSLYPGSEKTSEPDPSSTARSGLWKRKCEKVAEDASLTEREADVMFLLAKGYSASLIQERLCISINTVRCHTYNIYSKMDVHSKSELINLIESIDAQQPER